MCVCIAYKMACLKYKLLCFYTFVILLTKGDNQWLKGDNPIGTFCAKLIDRWRYDAIWAEPTSIYIVTDYLK